MANHQSAQKRIRINMRRRLQNRYQLKSCRTAIKQLKQTKDQQTATPISQSIYAMLDKLARKRVMHKNQAAHKKAVVAKHVNNLQ
ncbi:MAG: 30S ribosomal protein S20 [Bacteroidota bacterium]